MPDTAGGRQPPRLPTPFQALKRFRFVRRFHPQVYPNGCIEHLVVSLTGCTPVPCENLRQIHHCHPRAGIVPWTDPVTGKITAALQNLSRVQPSSPLSRLQTKAHIKKSCNKNFVGVGSPDPHRQVRAGKPAPTIDFPRYIGIFNVICTFFLHEPRLIGSLISQ